MTMTHREKLQATACKLYGNPSVIIRAYKTFGTENTPRQAPKISHQPIRRECALPCPQGCLKWVITGRSVLHCSVAGQYRRLVHLEKQCFIHLPMAQLTGGEGVIALAW